ncbi:MAG: S8 family serine peptidase [Acidimicrobiales bacterium]|nr:S8 family serine peptidase [Acidimicrobiales bacterium]
MSPVRPSAPQPAWSRDSRAVRLDDVAGLDEIGPRWAWEGATGEGVRVAIIDSGIEADHPTLGDCVDVDGGAEVVLVGDEAEVRPGPHDDVYGHGTACAGIIHSMAPGASIASIRVLNERLAGKSATFLAGLAWAIEQEFDVINLSLGTIKREYALAFHDLCDEAYFNGSFVVTAANNMRRVSYPSLYSSVASVACNLSEDPWRFHFNPEPPTEFLARGIDVEVAWRDGETNAATGNSYAAPHLAGIAARILSKHPELRPFQLKAVLYACAGNVQDAAHQMAGRVSRVIRSTRSTSAGRHSAMIPAPARRDV